MLKPFFKMSKSTYCMIYLLLQENVFYYNERSLSQNWSAVSKTHVTQYREEWYVSADDSKDLISKVELMVRLLVNAIVLVNFEGGTSPSFGEPKNMSFSRFKRQARFWKCFNRYAQKFYFDISPGFEDCELFFNRHFF